ncbi:Cohesin domain-containing protein [Methanolobus vulcani]|uniref:Cohesin domain-containing protein n=1 Tax=Methanolobus vulcani TaxID=38026 RepID=A0A7Z7AWC2_9EURY|nr:cohesin domain-containing protein [Methanolobus vulcani]SDF79950.1 Cohesin domain-containing protein [Methanolobus vulcani]
MTGKFLNFATGIIMVICILCLCGVASAATSVSILPSVETVAPGEQFTLDVYVRPDTQVAGLQFNLEFDSSLLNIESIEEGDFFSSTGSPVMFNPGTIDNDGGTATQIYGTLIMGDGTSDEGTFCSIVMKASEETGTSQIRIENIVVGDDKGDELNAVTYDSMVSISDETDTTNKDNGDGTDLKIVVKQDVNANSSANEESTPAAEEETTLQSVQDTTDSTDTKKSVPAPEAESGTSNISILAVAAVTFLALAYVLDRKRK